MKTRLHPPTTTAYFPPAAWVRAALATGEWTLEAHENYQKRGWRNRCRILGPNGVQTLSVPLQKGAHSRMPIREVRISYDQDWVREHRQAIRTAYGKAPYFDYFHEALFTQLDHRPERLWELNLALTKTLLELLGGGVEPTITDNFQPAAERTFPALRPYPQVFTDRHGFVRGLSILDALFCLGPTLATHPTDVPLAP